MRSRPGMARRRAPPGESGPAGGLAVTPGDEEDPEGFVQDYAERQAIGEDTQMVGCMALVVIAHLAAVLWLVSHWLDRPIPSWVGAVLAVCVVAAPKLYGLWRIDRSSLPVRIRGLLVKGRERRSWLIIAAVVIAAALLVTGLAPIVRNSLAQW